eukprot:s7276_g2.t1
MRARNAFSAADSGSDRLHASLCLAYPSAQIVHACSCQVVDVAPVSASSSTPAGDETIRENVLLKASDARHATAVKKSRAAAKAKLSTSAECLYALGRALETFNIRVSDFAWRKGDPLLMSDEDLDALDLLTVPTLVLLSDREGSQHLGTAAQQ